MLINVVHSHLANVRPECTVRVVGKAISDRCPPTAKGVGSKFVDDDPGVDASLS
jgi:hypothetical protein